MVGKLLKLHTSVGNICPAGGACKRQSDPEHSLSQSSTWEKQGVCFLLIPELYFN
jgi:hypothetical protein